MNDALRAAKASMRFGDTYGAVAVLEDVTEVCSYRGPIGGQVRDFVAHNFRCMTAAMRLR